MSKSQLADAIHHRVKFLGMGQSAFAIATGLNLSDLPDLINGEASEITEKQLEMALATLNLSDSGREIVDATSKVDTNFKTSKVDTNFKVEIGRRLALRRRELGFTQKILAEEVGLTRDFIAQVEVGRLELNAGDLPRVCVALDVSVSYFFSDLVKAPTDDPVLEGIRKLSAVAQGELTTQEASLLHNFRVLSEEGRDTVSNVSAEMASSKRMTTAFHQLLAKNNQLSQNAAIAATASESEQATDEK